MSEKKGRVKAGRDMKEERYGSGRRDNRFLSYKYCLFVYFILF